MSTMTRFVTDEEILEELERLNREEGFEIDDSGEDGRTYVEERSDHYTLSEQSASDNEPETVKYFYSKNKAIKWNIDEPLQSNNKNKYNELAAFSIFFRRRNNKSFS